MAYAQAEVHEDTEADIDAFLNAFVPLLPAITAYFGTGKGDGVLVNTEDQAVRRNRIGCFRRSAPCRTGAPT